MDTFFKITFLILGICFIIIFLGIYQKTGANRYQLSTNATGGVILDTQTGKIYQPEKGGYIDYKTQAFIKDLPK